MEQTSTAYALPSEQDLTQGLSKLRRASLLNIVSSLIMGIGIIALLIAFIRVGALRAHESAEGLRALASTLAGLVALFVFLAIGGIVALVATYAYLLPAFNSLKRYDNPSFGTPATLIKVGYLGGLVTAVIGVLIFISGVAISIATLTRGPMAMLIFISLGVLVLILGAMLLIIGELGLIVGLIKLNDRFKNSTFLAAAIMFIVGFFVAITTFIGWILVYVASGASMSKVEHGQEVPYLPPPPPQAV
ncbi:MAG: DUF973 family protein [Candidatus Bathyarchaeia archaeon]